MSLEARIEAIEAMQAVHEANLVAQQHALGAVFTVLAQQDPELGERLVSIMVQLEGAVMDRGADHELHLSALENLTELARFALERAGSAKGT